MKIGLTFDLKDDYIAAGLSYEEAAEFDGVATIDAIEGALRALGYEVERVGHLHALAQALVAGRRWDLVFNIAEGLYGYARESQVPALLDGYGVPYTFSDPMVLSLCLHKGMTKRVAASMGVRTPNFYLVEAAGDIASVSLEFPLFCKPVAEGTSKGVTSLSFVRDYLELEAACLQLLERFRQPVLVEEYLPGREFTVGIVGTGEAARALGAMEVVAMNEGVGAGYSFENKQSYHDRVRYLLATDGEGEAAVAEALKAWRVLGCRDGGRVDIRMDRYGQASFIEVNPLAGLHPVDSDIVILCRLLGVSYIELIKNIVDSAFERIAANPAPDAIWFGGGVGRDSGNHCAAHGPVGVAVGKSGASHGVTSEDEEQAPMMLVLHSEVSPESAPDEQDTMEEARYAEELGRVLGYRVQKVPFTADITGMRRRLDALAPKVVFNLAESIADSCRIIELAPAILEEVGLPYTGNSAEATFCTASKVVAKRMMSLAGVPTAPWAHEPDLLTGQLLFPGPYIVKYVWEHASIGLGEGSVVDDVLDAQKRVGALKNIKSGELFIEQYIDGREFNVSLLASGTGVDVMPVAEILFTGYPEGRPKIVDYAAKWDDDSQESRATVRSFDFGPADSALLKQLEDIARKCWDLFGLGGYARVDFRVDGAGNPFVLEVNTNPCLSPDAGFMAACAAGGFPPEVVMRRIVEHAEKRFSK